MQINVDTSLLMKSMTFAFYFLFAILAFISSVMHILAYIGNFLCDIKELCVRASVNLEYLVWNKSNIIAVF